MNFGQALEKLKNGNKVARKGWNGKNMFIYLVNGTTIEVSSLRNEAYKHLKDLRNEVDINPHIDMKAANGDIVVGWLASQSDMLSDDWEVVE